MSARASLVDEQDAERLRVADDRRTALATMGLGGVMLVMAVAVLTSAVRLDNGGSAIGPATAPYVVGSVMFVVAVLMVVRGRRDMGVWEYSDHVGRQDWQRLAMLFAVLVVYAVLMPLVGYVVTSALLFGVTAILLGAPRGLRPFAYGWCVAVVVYLVFDGLIGIALPTGPWGF